MSKSTFLIMAVLLLAFSGCTTTRYVPVEHHTTDTVYQSKLQRDSVWIHDSIHVSEKGDTIRIERWRTKYVEREVHDTLYQSKCDSIPVPYEVIKEVPRKLSATQTAMMLIGLLTVIGIVLYIVFWIKKKFL